MRRAQSVCLCVAVALAIAVPFSSAFAQEGGRSPVTVRKISGSKAKTPEYKLLTGQVMGKSKDWFVVTCQYETDPDWVDELNFTYYIALKGKTQGQPRNSLLMGEVTYVNVQKGKHMSDMYLHPSTLLRYGDVEAVAVIVKVQGRVVAMDALPSTNQRWWENFSPLSGLVLNRMQTPFAMINFDDYEAIKPVSATR